MWSCVCLGFYWILFFLCLGGWMAWSLWSACDDSGLQMRSRVCGAQGNTPCVGNSTQRRDCNEIPGESVSTWIHCTCAASFKVVITGQGWPRFLDCGVLVPSRPSKNPKIHCMLFTKTFKLVIFDVQSRVHNVLVIPSGLFFAFSRVKRFCFPCYRHTMDKKRVANWKTERNHLWQQTFFTTAIMTWNKRINTGVAIDTY